MFCARLALLLFSLGLGCSPRQRDQPINNVVPAHGTHAPRTALGDAAVELRNASLGKGNLSSILADEDRQVQMRFACVEQEPGSRAPGGQMNRKRLLTELSHVQASEELSCDETTRCCSFVRPPGTAKMQATLAEACFGTDVQLSSLTIVEEDACRG
jgi:hypothetical protein